MPVVTRFSAYAGHPQNWLSQPFDSQLTAN